MQQHICHIALVVRDYDEAIAFYKDTLGFDLVEDSDMGAGKRWVLVQPPGGSAAACQILLAKAANEIQVQAIGNQSGGRVFLFLSTDNFDRDYAAYLAKGVKFVREPVVEAYGKVAVFEDLYGNRWDLIQHV